MSSFIRRLSSSIPGTNMSSSPPTTDTDSTTSIFRRKSSTTSSATDDAAFRSLGARDYKLAQTPSEQEAARRSSIIDLEGSTQDAAEGGTEDVKMERKGSVGRIYGARDWRLIGKDS